MATQPVYDTTIIALRFRDLALPAGDTIRLHQEIIATKKAAWWGWWNKSGETVPANALRQFTAEIQAKGAVEFLLFDSGQREIRRARCSRIVWDSQYARVPSPDIALTPTYYNQHQFLIWFQLAEILAPEADANATLQKLSYSKVDELFDTGESPYRAFYDKRVSDVDELKQQDRTMWFLRSFREGDKTHTISLVGKTSTEPTHFTRDYASSSSRSLLWLSDLHFGGGHHQFPTATTAAAKDLGQAINDALTQHGVMDLAGVIVSGDITWQAAAAEFDDAKHFLERIARSPTVLDFYRFAVCPGNHDLAFSPAPEDKEAQVQDTVASPVARAGYTGFYQHFFNIAPNEHLSMGRRILLGGHFPVEIVCLNTSLLQQKEGWFQGMGFVGDDQLSHAASQFGWGISYVEGTPKPFRIVVMHHHLVPVVFSEEPKGGTAYSVVLDAERVMRWLLRHRVDLVVHGHMHQRFYTKVVRPVSDGAKEEHCVTIIGLGSSGVEQSHRKNQQNMFGLLTAKRDAMTVRLYSVFPGNEEPQELWQVEVQKKD